MYALGWTLSSVFVLQHSWRKSHSGTHWCHDKFIIWKFSRVFFSVMYSPCGWFLFLCSIPLTVFYAIYILFSCLTPSFPFSFLEDNLTSLLHKESKKHHVRMSQLSSSKLQTYWHLLTFTFFLFHQKCPFKLIFFLSGYYLLLSSLNKLAMLIIPSLFFNLSLLVPSHQHLFILKYLF
jgi:hypothetical protein